MPVLPSTFRPLSGLALALTSLTLFACGSDKRAPTPAAAPDLRNISVSTAGENSLAAVVQFDNRDFVLARVRVTAGGETETTPDTRLVDGPMEIPVLGLLPQTDYSLTLEVGDASGNLTEFPLSHRTGALPDALANSLRIETTGESFAGLVLTDVRPTPEFGYLVAFDAAGRVRWYHAAARLGGYAEQLPNGNIATFIGSTSGWQPTYGYFQEITPLGQPVARYQAPVPFYTDQHDLAFTPSADGGYDAHLFTYDIRPTNMQQFGGPSRAPIAGHQLIRLRPNGELGFFWNAWDFISIDEWIEEPSSMRLAGIGDIDHPNSLSFDLDGHYIVSMRSMAQVMKIHSGDGRILWRWGGLENQFRMIGDPLGEFHGQHSVTVLPNGNFLLYDNGPRHTPPQSRAVEYRVDPVARTATMVWEYRHSPAIFTPFTGSVQRLANGNTLIGYAWANTATEVTAQGTVAWEAKLTFNGQALNAYRMKRIKSLYEATTP